MSDTNLEAEVAIVKNDITQIGRLFSKLEIALDKITDVPFTAATVTEPEIPDPVTNCPTLIFSLAAANVTAVELDTAPLTVPVVGNTNVDTGI